MSQRVVGLATKRQVCAVAAALLTLPLASAASVTAAVPVARAAGVVATGSDWTTDRYNNDRPTYRYRRLGVPRWRVVLRLVAKVPGPLRRAWDEQLEERYLQAVGDDLALQACHLDDDASDR